MLSAAVVAVSPRRWPRSAPRDCLVLFTLAGAAASAAMASGHIHPLAPLPGTPLVLAGFASATPAAAWLRGLTGPVQTWRSYPRTVVLLAVASFSLLVSLPLFFVYAVGAALGGTPAGGAGARCARSVYDRVPNACCGFFLAGAVGAVVGAVLVIPPALFSTIAIVELHRFVHG
ncbi:hypothetical protein J0910_19030 [Nocardiopsis sp. CNT-189]|uniref:hypothetical protein n=1 Tax=Nocardiopsis oceanisediminis TaxID=2816862 RepID=UPI003B2DF885